MRSYATRRMPADDKGSTAGARSGSADSNRSRAVERPSPGERSPSAAQRTPSPLPAGAPLPTRDWRAVIPPTRDWGAVKPPPPSTGGPLPPRDWGAVKPPPPSAPPSGGGSLPTRDWEAAKPPARDWGAVKPPTPSAPPSGGVSLPTRDWGAAKPPARDWGAMKPPTPSPPPRASMESDNGGPVGQGASRQGWGQRGGAGDGFGGGGGGMGGGMRQWGNRDGRDRDQMGDSAPRAGGFGVDRSDRMGGGSAGFREGGEDGGFGGGQMGRQDGFQRGGRGGGFGGGQMRRHGDSFGNRQGGGFGFGQSGEQRNAPGRGAWRQRPERDDAAPPASGFGLSRGGPYSGSGIEPGRPLGRNWGSSQDELAKPLSDSPPLRGQGSASDQLDSIDPLISTLGGSVDTSDWEDSTERRNRFSAGNARNRRRSVEAEYAARNVEEDDDEGVAFNRGGRKGGAGTRSTKEQRYMMEQEEKQARERRRREKELARQQTSRSSEKEVLIPSTVTVTRLATIFGQKIGQVQARMRRLGMSIEKHRADYILNGEEACDIALEFGFDPIIDDEAAFDLLPEPEKEGEVHPLRPPVVTIMGHVDHGKTTLLDSLRNTAVAAGEAGGITQHIGAFSVPLKLLQKGSDSDATITFLDTPGHAAFTGMRARGASVTDIVVLVVAADDGVMPQTKEVLQLVKSEGDNVGLVVAINKVDKPGIDLRRVKNELMQEGIHLEEDGGDVQSVRVSGLARMGLDNLVETLSTLAELRDLRARSTGKAEGYILESNVDRGIGRVATVLVTRGTLNVGSVVVAGHSWCKIRRMTDHTGAIVESAGPGMPVVLTGWKNTPVAGDELLEAPNGEREATKAIANRKALSDRQKMTADSEVINVKRVEDRAKLDAEQEAERAVKNAGGNLADLRLAERKKAAKEAAENVYQELRLIVKGDVSGTVEAVEGALSGIGNKEAGVKIIHTGVGEVNESDVAMAEAVGGMIIGFNVPCAKATQQYAVEQRVDIHLESVIYRLIETVRKKTAALLPPLIESRTIGEGTVGDIFHIKLSKRQTQVVAGVRCTNGTFNSNDLIRVVRGSERRVVFEGPIKTLKHLKKDVDEVRKGMECGVAFEGFDDVMIGDEVVTYKTFEVAREL